MQDQSLIYLATPYTHNDRAIMQQRYEWACEIAGLLMLHRCDEIWIVTMSGWQESVGIAAEIELAVDWGKSISKLDPDTLDRTGWMLEAIA
jgi:hypothetical protein